MVSVAPPHSAGQLRCSLTIMFPTQSKSVYPPPVGRVRELFEEWNLEVVGQDHGAR